MTDTIEAVRNLNAMTRGVYDLQQLRIQAGLRLVANFRAKLKKPEPELEEDGELSKEAQELIATLKAAHKRLTDGVARNRTLPSREGFTGDEVISSYAELALVDQYVTIEGVESRGFRELTGVLDGIPIYAEYLKDVRGVGPAMAAVLISRLDPHRARHPSSFWKFTGLDVGPDGRGRSRREEHLVERTYIDKNGDEKTRRSITYDPWLKTKVVGVLGSSFGRLHRGLNNITTTSTASRPIRCVPKLHLRNGKSGTKPRKMSRDCGRQGGYTTRRSVTCVKCFLPISGSVGGHSKACPWAKPTKKQDAVIATGKLHSKACTHRDRACH